MSDHENTIENEDTESLEPNDCVESSSISDNYLKKSDILAALQIDSFDNLPVAVKNRINALKNLQLQVTNLEAKFYEEVHLLECKYNKMYYPIHEKRHNIITGLYEPIEAECDWKLDSEVEKISKELKDKVEVEDVSEKKIDEQTPDSTTIVGIPLFWLKAFKNVPTIAEMIQPCDEPILSYLIDVKSILLEADPMGFVLEFHFAPNEYFSNSVLTKEYEMKCIPDPCDPFSFVGPEIVKCKGCKIDWKKGKNVTIKQVKKKQKHKNRSAVTRTVIKTVSNDSFFHFFNPPEVPDDSESESYEETQSLLTSDFEIGHYIRERVVPNAVLFFTGDAIDSDFDEDDEEGEEEEDERDEENSDSDDSKDETDKRHNELTKKKAERCSSGSLQNSKTALAGVNSNVPECKQQ